MFVTTTCLGWVPALRTDEAKAVLLAHVLDECRFRGAVLHAYCLMDHHLHLVVRADAFLHEPIHAGAEEQGRESAACPGSPVDSPPVEGRSEGWAIALDALVSRRAHPLGARLLVEHPVPAPQPGSGGAVRTDDGLSAVFCAAVRGVPVDRGSGAVAGYAVWWRANKVRSRVLPRHSSLSISCPKRGLDGCGGKRRRSLTSKADPVDSRRRNVITDRNLQLDTWTVGRLDSPSTQGQAINVLINTIVIHSRQSRVNVDVQVSALDNTIAPQHGVQVLLRTHFAKCPIW